MAETKSGLEKTPSWLRLWQYTTVYEEERFWWLGELVSNPKYAPALQYSLVLLEALLGLKKRCFQLAWVNGKPVVQGYEEATSQLAQQEEKEIAENSGFEEFQIPPIHREQISTAVLQLSEFFVDRPYYKWLNIWLRLLACLLWAKEELIKSGVSPRLKKVKRKLQETWERRQLKRSQEIIEPAWRNLKKVGLV